MRELTALLSFMGIFGSWKVLPDVPLLLLVLVENILCVSDVVYVVVVVVSLRYCDVWIQMRIL
jgi:hypothetical protein